MKQYLDLMKNVLENGTDSTDRTGIGTRKLLGQQMRFDLSEGFPAVTTKRLAWKAMVSELLWFIEGSGDERRLCEILHGTRDASKKTIWTANYEKQAVDLGYTDGNLGPVYGVQWRKWESVKVPDNFTDINVLLNQGYTIEDTTQSDRSVLVKTVDQIQELVDGLKNDPYSRRHILSAWNVGELSEMALPPCHCFSQFFVVDGKLSCHLYQRSGDTFLGIPFNIASYSLLTHMLAQVCGYEVGEFIWTGGDCHIYLNHLDQVQEQLKRTPDTLPVLKIDTSIKDIGAFSMDSFELLDYNPQATIKAPMAV